MLQTAQGPIIPTGAAAVAAPIGALQLCAYAASELRRIGFDLHYVSMRSESCYYRMPGGHGVIRISAHGGGRRDARSLGMPILGRITFTAQCSLKTIDQVDSEIAMAVGRYFLNRSLSDQPHTA